MKVKEECTGGVRWRRALEGTRGRPDDLGPQPQARERSSHVAPGQKPTPDRSRRTRVWGCRRGESPAAGHPRDPEGPRDQRSRREPPGAAGASKDACASGRAAETPSGPRACAHPSLPALAARSGSGFPRGPAGPPEHRERRPERQRAWPAAAAASGDAPESTAHLRLGAWRRRRLSTSSRARRPEGRSGVGFREGAAAGPAGKMPVAVMAESAFSFKKLLDQCENQELEVAVGVALGGSAGSSAAPGRRRSPG